MERGAREGDGRRSPPPSWIRFGIGLAAAGYAAAAVHGVVALELEWLRRGPEVGAALVLAIAYLASDRSPRAAAVVALATIWLELAVSIFVGGPRTFALEIYPVLVVGTAFVLGGRAGLLAAVVSAAAIPAAAMLGERLAGARWTGEADVLRAVVAAMVCLGTGVMTHVALAAHGRAERGAAAPGLAGSSRE